MKCQNCGKNECTFHYSYSVNGRTSEVHLCSGCADKLGYSDNVFLSTDTFFGGDRLLDDMFSGFFRRPLSGFGLMPGVTILPRISVRTAGERTAEAPREEKPDVDPEIQKRREINMLREQMKRAAEAEDYEQAAEIRDKIKNMEKPEN